MNDTTFADDMRQAMNDWGAATDEQRAAFSKLAADMAARAQAYQPKTGVKCSCRAGRARDNCPACEGTGWHIDFRAIRARR